MSTFMRCACTAVVLGWLCAAPALGQFGGPAKVNVAAVEMRPLPASITLVGTLEPVTRSVIGSETGGLVVAMPVRQGDFVRAGDLICKLKDDTLTLQLTEARERLKGLEADHRKWVFEQQRIDQLYGTQDAAEKEVYETEAALAQAQFAVSEQQATVARLETELVKTEIRAPYSGFIIDRHAEVGQWLERGGPVVDLVDLSTVLVRVDLPETAISHVRVGDAASVQIEALHQEFDATVRHVMLQADATARTFPVEIAVPNPGYVEVDGRLLPRSIVEPHLTGENPADDTAAGSAAHDVAARNDAAHADHAPAAADPGVGHVAAGHGATAGSNPGASPGPPGGHGAGGPPGIGPEHAQHLPPALLAGGMFARAKLRAGPAAPVPAVPKDAVVMRDGVEFVCLVAPGREEGSLMGIPMPVTTGVDVGDWIAVTSGNLHPGMQVVTKGNENILFPSPIEIVQPLGAAAGAAAPASTNPPPTEANAGS